MYTDISDELGSVGIKVQDEYPMAVLDGTSKVAWYLGTNVTDFENYKKGIHGELDLLIKDMSSYENRVVTTFSPEGVPLLL